MIQTVNINETVMLWIDVIWIWTDTAAAYLEINYYVLCIMSPLAYIIFGFLSIDWFLFISVYTFCLFWKCLIKFISFFLCFGSLLCMESKEPVFVCVYCLCHVLYISVHRCHCWLVCLTFCVVFSFLFKCIKMGYYVLEFFIGIGNRDIMTKELSLIFFCVFCLSIYSICHNLSHVNPM